MSRCRLILVSIFFGWLLACSLGIPLGLMSDDQRVMADEKSPATTKATTSPTVLATQVLAIFTSKCTECHSPDATGDDADEARQQVTDMADLAVVKRNVKPGDLTTSRLWNAVKPEDGFMPPDSAKEGKLSAAQIETIRQWILAGAPLPTTRPIDAEDNP